MRFRNEKTRGFRQHALSAVASISRRFRRFLMRCEAQFQETLNPSEIYSMAVTTGSDTHSSPTYWKRTLPRVILRNLCALCCLAPRNSWSAWRRRCGWGWYPQKVCVCVRVRVIVRVRVFLSSLTSPSLALNLTLPPVLCT